MYKSIILLFVFIIKAYSESDIIWNQRHMIAIERDIESVLGNYVFAVINKSDEIKEINIPISIPKETIDFKPSFGINENNIVLDKKGDLYIKKKVFPGNNIIVVYFKVFSGSTSGKLTIKLKYDLQKLVVVGEKPIKLYSKDLNIKEKNVIPERAFIGFSNSNILKKGQEIVVEYSGVIASRKNYWLAALSILSLLYILFFIKFFKNTIKND